MSFDRQHPYNALPPLPPPGVELETKAVLKAALKAHAQIAKLDEAIRLLPDPEVLIHALPLQEAQASSAIENIVTTQDKLFRSAAAEHEPDDPAQKEVFRYREALLLGSERLRFHRPMTTNLIVDICSTLRGREMEIRRMPGTKIANPVTGETLYTPPEGESAIRDKLANFEKFWHGEDGSDLDPLVRLAAMHYQFEAIHPFHDGNGRTGRILNILYLQHRQMLDLPVLYLSAYIIEHRDEYYRLLRGVTERGEWEPWILYMLAALADTAWRTHYRVDLIRDEMEGAIRRCKEAGLPVAMYSQVVVATIFRQPYCKVEWLVRAGIAQRQTAAKYLKAWERAGVLTSEKVGRERYYLNRAFLAWLIAPSSHIPSADDIEQAVDEARRKATP